MSWEQSGKLGPTRHNVTAIPTYPGVHANLGHASRCGISKCGAAAKPPILMKKVQSGPLHMSFKCKLSIIGPQRCLLIYRHIRRSLLYLSFTDQEVSQLFKHKNSATGSMSEFECKRERRESVSETKGTPSYRPTNHVCYGHMGH